MANEFSLFEMLALLTKIQQQAKTLKKVLVNGVAVTPRDLEILLYINENKTATGTDLMRACDVTGPLVSQQTWRLIQRHLLTRQVDNRDRRKVQLSLSETGHAFLNAMEHQIQTNLNDYVQGGEYEQLVDQFRALKRTVKRNQAPT